MMERDEQFHFGYPFVTPSKCERSDNPYDQICSYISHEFQFLHRGIRNDRSVIESLKEKPGLSQPSGFKEEVDNKSVLSHE